jgi:hypothetical protein
MDEPVRPTAGRGEVPEGGAVFVVLAKLGGDLVAGWAGDALVLGQSHADHATTAASLGTAQQGLREPAGREPLSARSPVVGNGHFGYRVCRGGE